MRVREVDLGRARTIEHREGGLEERTARVRHDLRIPDGPRLVGRQRVNEGIVEFPEAPPDDLAPAERDEQDPAQRQERGRLEGEDALWRRRVDRDAGRTQPAVEEQLDEEPPERVADEDRRL